MTLKIWENTLLKHLGNLPSSERNAAIAYYREMYGDKLDAGYSHQEILQEFGTPEACAKRILSDNTNELLGRERIPAPRVHRTYSIASLIGMFFLTVLLILPLASVAFSLIVTFAAVSVSGVAVSLAGVLLTVVSPFLALSGIPLPTVIPNMGIGICAVGVGAVLFAAFFFATKYCTLWSYKALRFIYIRRTNP